MWPTPAYRISCHPGGHTCDLEFGPPLDPALRSQRYPPLRQSTRQIRLAMLEPTFAQVGDDGRVPLLTVTTLDTRCEGCGMDLWPSYCALSYACGDPNVTRLVLVNGYAMSVTSNLRAFLEQATLDLTGSLNGSRSTGSSKLPYWVAVAAQQGQRAFTQGVVAIYWIDSICINQLDLPEKSHQVAHMGLIYRNAQRVVAWLGPHKDHSDLVFHLISHAAPNIKLARAHMESNDYADRVVEANVTYTKACNRAIESCREQILKAFGQVPSPDVCCFKSVLRQALTAFSDRSYWTRAWVIREMALAADDTMAILCGNHAANVRDFDDAFQLLAPALELNLAEFGPSLLRRQATSRREQQQHLAIVLADVGMLGKIFASSPHDYIYSLLPLADDIASCGIHPDYSISARRLYIEVASYLSQHLGLLFLRFCRLDHAHGDSFDLPSWVPNWSTLNSMVSIVDGEHGINVGRLFSCTGDGPRPRIIGAIAGDILVTTGSELGRVTAIYKDGCMVCRIRKIDEQGGLDNGFNIDPQDLYVDLCCALADHFRLGAHELSKLPPNLVAEIWRADHNGSDCCHLIRPSDISDLTVARSLRKHCYDSIHERSKALRDRGFVHFSSDLRHFVPDGLGPDCMQVGDSVFAIVGSDVPCILRKTDGGNWLHVGQAYLRGAMDGEMVNDQTEWQEVRIV